MNISRVIKFFPLHLHAIKVSGRYLCRFQRIVLYKLGLLCNEKLLSFIGESLDAGGIGPVTLDINWGGLCSAVDSNRLI